MTKAAAEGQRILPRHVAFYIALAVGAVGFVAGLLLAPKYAVGIGANAMFASFLVLIAFEIKRLTPAFLKRRAAEADEPVAVIFLATVLVIGVAVVYLFLVLNGTNGPRYGEIAVSVLSVVLGWFVIHTMAALHYAYEYYEVLEASAKPGRGQGVVGGLEFPGKDEPDGVAFLYFSYVVGMTAQVADVNVASNAMRKLVAIHGVFAFFFNTIILAATVNVVVSIGSGG